MFKKIKNLILRFCWFVSPDVTSTFWSIFFRLSSKIITFFHDFIFLFSPILRKIKSFITDFRSILFNSAELIWVLISKHRLMYILRLAFLIFLLYRPTLVDLDSVYWTLSILFYFVTNNFFFLFSYINPFSDWTLAAPTLKIIIFLIFLPALYSSKKLKKRLKKKRKIIAKDHELIFLFQWSQRLLVFTFYVSLCYLAFFFISILAPLLYLYLFDLNFNSPLSFKLVYFMFFKNIKYLNIFFDFFFNCNFIFFNLHFFTLFLKILFLFIESVIFVNMAIFLSNSYFFLLNFFYFSFFSFLYFSKFYWFSLFQFFKFFFLFFLFFKNFFFKSLSVIQIFEIFKTFLFSDNFFIFLFWILNNLISTIFNLLFYFLNLVFQFIIEAHSWLLHISLYSVASANISIILDFFLTFFYLFLTKLLSFITPVLALYLKDLSFFGLISTWYEYLNHGVQRGILQNSFLNWMFVHLYASIIAFWFLDFDFRVSVKTPPKTPNTLLKEAKKTQDWIPQNMDFLTLQTNEAKIYFAMLDISFEHVESLQFIYGDFEYIDEEYDMEDETPDEEEFFNESEETLKVREIIESDLGFTKRPTKMSEDDPLDSKSNLERHHLGEIVGEPELIYIEEPLKWAFSSLYSPTFEELHFKDSLFSEWVFDPDEDLTFFEFLLLFPFLFFCLYVWFFHRRKKRHFRSYLKFFVSTRRTVFSGWWVENFLGFPIGEWSRYFFDKMRHHTAPDVKFSRLHKFRMYRNRQKIKLMQMEAFHFERLRIKLYRESLKNWEDFTAKSIRFLAPNKKKHYLYSTVRQFKRETREWAMLGDWAKFFWKPEPTPEKTSFFFESLQVSLSHLIDKFVNRRGRKKIRKNLWRTIQHIPGHLSMPYYPKIWYSRFNNTFLFFPTVTTRYSYNYYNYIGWRDNRAKWKRYAFTPGNVIDKVFEYNRSLQRRDYNFYKRWQRRRRLMRVFQF